MKYCLAIGLFLMSHKPKAQVDEVVLTDTVRFLCSSIGSLVSDKMTQEAFRLNFDDCNIEYTRYLSRNRYEIREFWLNKLDVKKMQIDFNEVTNEWTLRLEGESEKMIQATGSWYSAGWKSYLYLHSKEKDPLVSIRDALNYAVKSCKGLDRFKD